MRIDVLGDTAIAFFISHTTVKLKRQAALHEPTFRATMIFQRTDAGWRVIHYHESSLAASAAQVMSSAS
jgi:ketosteroid isomerase-like protein